MPSDAFPASATLAANTVQSEPQGPRCAAIPIAIVFGLALIGMAWTICFFVRLRKYRVWRKRVKAEEKRTGRKIIHNDDDDADDGEREKRRWDRCRNRDAEWGTAGMGTGLSKIHKSLTSSHGQDHDDTVTLPEAIYDPTLCQPEPRKAIITLQEDTGCVQLTLAQPVRPNKDEIATATTTMTTPSPVPVAAIPKPYPAATAPRKIAGRQLTPYRHDKPLPCVSSPVPASSPVSHPIGYPYAPSVGSPNPSMISSASADLIPAPTKAPNVAPVAQDYRRTTLSQVQYAPSSPSFVSSVFSNPPEGRRAKPSRLPPSAISASVSGRSNANAPWPVLTREPQRASGWSMYLD
jgi:hypothetical protein